MLEPLDLTCPYCGEGFESLYDESEAAFGGAAVGVTLPRASRLAPEARA